MTNSTDWIGEPASQAPTILSHWNGLPIITLSKIKGGARLLWLFDDYDNVQLGAFVRLTDAEAQAVYDTPPDVGLLERVRERLQHRVIFVWRTAGGLRFEIAAVEIPKGGTEEEFSSSLQATAMGLEHRDTSPELEPIRQTAERSVARTLGVPA